MRPRNKNVQDLNDATEEPLGPFRSNEDVIHVHLRKRGDLPQSHIAFGFRVPGNPKLPKP